MATYKEQNKLNVPHLRFPEFHGEWCISTIGEQFDLYSGNTPSRLNKAHFEGNVNWITSGELKEHYISDTKEKISEVAATANNLKLLHPGTFVIAIYGLEADGVRGTGSITCKESTISQACMAFTQKGDVKNEFLYSWYKKHGNIIGIKYAQGTKQQNLSYDILEKFHIAYPSQDEQDKLIKFISLLDERIATQSKLIEKLESLIKGICNNYFEKLSVQEEAYLIRLSDILKERNEYCCKDGKFIHGTLSKDGIFPKTGRWDRDFLVKQEDKKYKVTHLDDICYNPANLKFGVICRNTFGDLIFSPIYVTFEVCKNVNIGFIELYLTNHNFIEKVRRFEQGTVYERMAVSPEDFLSYKIRIPSYSDQTFFYKKVQWLIKLSQNEMKLLSQYKKLRQYLLREMFI
ncbi:restriction endonuclease subunit S [Segatella copri]|nr:restriction endonuclease subunit S [Segatella copri]MQN70154.1 restriction endonuclease subunit S [Segatella copri]MQO02320.1 restriction endonuclease subunit S [Segatella copri]